MDALAEVLAVTGVRGTVAASLAAGEGWGLVLEAVPGAAFHAVVEGTAWLATQGSTGTQLLPGDVVLLPSGAQHVLTGTPGAVAEPFDHAAAERALTAGEPMRLGSGAARTRILCASYRQDPAVRQPLLSLLPDVLHIPARDAGPGLEATLRLLAVEARAQAGTAVVLDKALDILLVQVLRWWLATDGTPGRVPCWLGGLADPVVGPALAALHGEPGHDWTLDALAARVGVSRATLARRFRQQVGTAPGTYLTRWRMDLAARRLRDTDETAGAIARSLGYTSEYAFNRAFARVRRTTPGRFRTTSRGSRR